MEPNPSFAEPVLAIAAETILIRREASMVVRVVIFGVASAFMLGPVLGQRSQIPELTQNQPDSRTVLGAANEYLAAGAEAIRLGEYEEGIRLTKLGLDRPASPRDRAAALSNLCAAHAAKKEPDVAIGYCTESLTINDANWRAYSNRAYAYYLKRMFDEADKDLDVALSINPSARQMPQIRGMMNERRLRGRVTMEEHH
jgi:tetratricopeptide (TPR) repeat protein